MKTYSKPKRLQSHGALTKNWYTRVYDGGRRSWQSLGTDDYQEARRLVNELAVHAAELGRPSALSFGTLVKEYLVYVGARAAPITQDGAVDRLNKALTHFGAEAPVASLTTARFLEFTTALSAAGLAPTTINSILARLSALFEWALRAEYVRVNPLKRVPRLKEIPKAIRVLTPDEERRLLEAAELISEDMYGIVLLSIYSGLRQGTIRALCWTDVDLEAGRWAIPAEKTKTRRPFTCPIAAEVVAYLKARKDEKAGEGAIFPFVHNTVWERTRAHAGLCDVKLHDLRRNFATRCRRAGVPLEVACALGGWADSAVLLKHYRAVEEQDLRESLQKAFAPAPISATISAPQVQTY